MVATGFPTPCLGGTGEYKGDADFGRQRPGELRVGACGKVFRSEV